MMRRNRGIFRTPDVLRDFAQEQAEPALSTRGRNRGLSKLIQSISEDPRGERASNGSGERRNAP
jgi:hypothetical protein